jgi:transketolase
MMGLPVVYAFTHDSIGLGEDGPTHQPVEQLPGLRAVPNLEVIRPADAAETVGAWRCALERGDGPTALALTRQGLPALPGSDAERVAEGAYPVVEAREPDVVLVATGSEVAVAADAAEMLAREGLAVRVVSMPCRERFAARPPAERETVLPAGVPTVSVEAAADLGWGRWSDVHVGMDGFGASAPYDDLYAHFGITAEAVAEAARSLLGGGARRAEEGV